MKLSLVGSFILAVAGAGFGFFYSSFAEVGNTPAMAQLAGDQSVVKQRADDAPKIPAIPTQQKTATPILNDANNHWSATSLATALKRSSSYRLFVQDALRKPEKGGVLYAQSVVFACTKASDALSGIPQASTPKRDAILAEFKTHCDITLDQFNAQLRAQPNTQERDPLFAMMNDLASNQPEIRKKALAEALKTQDPMLLFETAALSFSRRVAPNGEGGVEKVLTYFNGQWLDEGDSAPFRYAQKLAACDFGLPCQQNDVWLNTLCVTANECASSRQEYMARFVYPNQPQWQSRIEQYRAAITAAVKSQSVAAFVPGK